MNKKEKNTLLIFTSISLAIVIAIIIIAPMAGEDYGLTKLFHDETLFGRIKFAFDRSLIQMTYWNARLGEQVAIFELSLPRYISLTIYSLSFIAFAVTVSMLSSFDQTDKWKKVSAYVASLTFLLWPGMEVFFWKTANSGYLQTMVLTMVAIIPFSNITLLESFKNKKVIYSLYLLICFLAGMSFENVPFAVAISMLTLCFWQKRKNALNYLPIIAIIFGWILLISAHSTAVRRKYYADTIPHSNEWLTHYLDRFKDVISTFIETSWILFVLAIISLIYLAKLKIINKYHICLIWASILVVGSMLASPYTEPRSFLFAWCVMFSITCFAFSIFVERNGAYKISTLILFSSFCYGIYTLSIYSSYAEMLNKREKGILKSLGTEKCKQGYEIGILNDDHGYRYVNNRDEWYFYNMINKSDYYNCLITNKK